MGHGSRGREGQRGSPLDNGEPWQILEGARGEDDCSTSPLCHLGEDCQGLGPSSCHGVGSGGQGSEGTMGRASAGYLGLPWVLER